MALNSGIAKAGLMSLEECDQQQADVMVKLLQQKIKNKGIENVIIQETIDFIHAVKSNYYDVKLIQTSGQPHRMLVKVMQILGLSGLFDEIYGAYTDGVGLPQDKTGLITFLRKQYYWWFG